MAYEHTQRVDSSIDLLSYTCISAIEDLIEARIGLLDFKLSCAETVAVIDNLHKQRHPLLIAQKRFNDKIREYEEKARLAPKTLTLTA